MTVVLNESAGRCAELSLDVGLEYLHNRRDWQTERLPLLALLHWGGSWLAASEWQRGNNELSVKSTHIVRNHIEERI